MLEQLGEEVCGFNHKQSLKNLPDFSVLLFQVAKYVPYIPQKSKLLNFMYFEVWTILA